MKDYPQNPANGIWKRRVLTERKSGSVLVLHDHRDYGAVTETAGTLSRADVGGTEDDPINFLPHVTPLAAGVSEPETLHAICHIRTSRKGFAENLDGHNPADTLFGVGTTGKKVIALQATSQSSLSDKCHLLELGGNYYIWLPMNNREAYRKMDLWLPEFVDLDFDKAKLIAEAADRGMLPLEIQRKYAHLLDITHPGDVTAELAFRLLCEAVVLCRGKATGKVGDIPITAPTQLEHWIAPFSPSGTTYNQKIEAIVAMMGLDAAKASTRSVLETARDGGSVLAAAITFPGVRAYSTTQPQTEETAQ